MMLRLLLLFSASVVVCEAVSVPTCDRSLCSCPVPNGELGDAVMSKDASDASCVCACGREEGATCTSDDHCSRGTSCSPRKDLGQGDDLICNNNCATKHCKQYHNCVLVDYEPVCQCNTFNCDPTIAAPVVGTRGNEMKMFGNKCQMIDENCKEAMYNENYDPWSV